MNDNTPSSVRQDMLRELDRRVGDHVLESADGELLKQLIADAKDDDTARRIMALGTTYKRTGFHFDVRLDRPTSDIKYLRRNADLSFPAAEGGMTHTLIVGDNYDALCNLLIQYKRRISVIYIDPPYGKDSMGEFAATNYDNAITRDNLLSMLHLRLQVARQLLTDDGVIFCSIDDRNQAYVKCLFDEVFGKRNFVASLIWKSKSGGANDSQFFAVDHEYILVYARNRDRFKLLKDKEAVVTTSYNYEDERGKYALDRLDKQSIRYSESLDYEIIGPNGESYKPQHRNPSHPNATWRWGRETVKNRYNELVFKNGCVYTKNYQSDGATPRSLLVDERFGRTRTGKTTLTSILGLEIFSNPKPYQLIKFLLEVAYGKDAVVLDFFAGSGTTGQAVMELNRKDGGNRRFILCQANEKTDKTPHGIVADVTARRLKRVMTGEDYDGTKDFPWAASNSPYGDGLEVLDIAAVKNNSASHGQTPLDVIDERLYGLEGFATLRDKLEWVCSNFAHTQRRTETDEEWETRKRQMDDATRS